MLVAPILHIDAISRADLNQLLVAWGHRMGPYTRPVFAVEAHHAMFEHGEPVAVAAAGEAVREVVGQTGIRREQCVEIARLTAAVCLLLPFVNHAAGEGHVYLAAPTEPEMDAADICSAAAKALSIELGGPDYMAIIAAGKTQAALHGGENAGGGADAP